MLVYYLLKKSVEVKKAEDALDVKQDVRDAKQDVKEVEQDVKLKEEEDEENISSMEEQVVLNLIIIDNRQAMDLIKKQIFLYLEIHTQIILQMLQATNHLLNIDL